MREGPAIGAFVHRFDVCGSTNDEARTLAEAGAVHGTAVVAEEQTKGRGTKGRVWYSARGKGLYVSYVLRPLATGLDPRALPLLTLAAGLAGAEAVREVTGVSARLKWPNDLVWEKLKFGGVLAESVFRGGDAVYTILGVGINVGHGPEDFPKAFREVSTSLGLITGGAVDKSALFSGLCRSLQSWYNALHSGRTEKIVRAYETNMAFSLGERIFLTARGKGLRGTFRGLSLEGRLRIETEADTEEIPFEDIQALEWDG